MRAWMYCVTELDIDVRGSGKRTGGRGSMPASEDHESKMAMIQCARMGMGSFSAWRCISDESPRVGTPPSCALFALRLDCFFACLYLFVRSMARVVLSRLVLALSEEHLLSLFL